MLDKIKIRKTIGLVIVAIVVSIYVMASAENTWSVLMSDWWNANDNELLQAREYLKSSNKTNLISKTKILHDDWWMCEEKEIESALNQIENLLIEHGNRLITTEEEKSLDFTSEIGVGDSVLFGAWDYEETSGKKRERIKWKVIKVEDDDVLMTTTYSFAMKYKYDNEDKDTVFWYDSLIRLYLNAYAYYLLFSEDEQYCISCDYTEYIRYKGEEIGTTKDRLFLLSYEECRNLLLDGIQSVTVLYDDEICEVNNCYIWTRTINEEGNQAIAYKDLEDNGLLDLDKLCAACPTLKLNRKVTKFGKNKDGDFVAMLDKSTEKTIHFLDLEWGSSSKEFQDCLSQHGYNMKCEKRDASYCYPIYMNTIGNNVYDYMSESGNWYYGKYEPIDKSAKIASHPIIALQTYDEDCINKVNIQLYYNSDLGFSLTHHFYDYSLPIYNDLKEKLTDIYGTAKVETMESPYAITGTDITTSAEWIGNNGTGIQLVMSKKQDSTRKEASVELNYMCFKRNVDKEMKYYNENYKQVKKKTNKINNDISGL